MKDFDDRNDGEMRYIKEINNADDPYRVQNIITQYQNGGGRMNKNHNQRGEIRHKNEYASPRNKWNLILGFLILICLIFAVFSFYFIWTWYNDTIFEGSAIATGRDGDVKLYVKFNRTVKLNECTVVNFTLENSGKTTYRFYPLDAGGCFSITTKKGDEIYYSHECIDYFFTNYSFIELHPGEKTYGEHSYLPYSAGMKIGEDYFITCYYSSLVILNEPYIVKYWEGDIVTNKVMIRVV